MPGHTPRMSGSRRVRTALTQALTAACVVLLCVFGAGPAAATVATTVAESRPASTAPSEPTEGPSDPSAEPETRAAVRLSARGIPTGRLKPLPLFHVKHAGAAGVALGGPVARTAAAVPSTRTVRSMVLRC